MDKQDLMGASAEADRATHEQSPQAVSAVPVGIPSALRDRLHSQISSALAQDPVCCGRVCTGTLDWIADEAMRACEAVLRTERGAVVKWLREDAISLDASEEPRDWPIGEAVNECADAIEAGEHAFRQDAPEPGQEQE